MAMIHPQTTRIPPAGDRAAFVESGLMLAFTVLWVVSGVHVAAWGMEGHQAVAMIAEQRLTAQARSAVRGLLLGESMASVSLWADDVRDTTHPETYNWHFVDIPLSAGGYDAARDCRPTERGDCIIAALDRLERDLANPAVPQGQRREALMFVIHFVGDLHQPLHDIDNHDAGGNRVVIAEIGNATNLHAAWDVGIIHASGKAAPDLAAGATRWLRNANDRQLALGSYADWAMEGFRIAKTVVYPQVQGTSRISDADRRLDISIIEEQIAKAGVRLASVLNRALDQH